VGYHPEKIIELKKFINKNNIKDEVFTEMILKENTISFEKRKKLINKFKIGTSEEKETILDFFKNYKSGIEGIFKETSSIDKEVDLKNKKDACEFFKKFGANDLTDYFENSRFNPAIGRDEDIRRIENILKQKEKSCALIIGPSGSGITNLALTVSQRIIKQKVKGLIGCPVYKIDSAFLNVGNVSGDLERTLKDIVTNARKSQAILLFDDCEQLEGQGVHRGTNHDVLDRLLPSIDGLKILFATSEDKFQDRLSKKTSFVRKTEIVKIKELDIKSTKEIMRMLSYNLLIENKTKFTYQIINDIEDLSEHIRNRHLPDKLISLLEKVSLNCKPSKRYTVSKIKRKDIIETLKKDFQIRLIEDITYRSKLYGLKEKLKEFVKGQDNAINIVSNELKIREFRRKESVTKPIVLYFTGPTGTGKTYLAKMLAEQILESKDAFFRIDMSQLCDYSKLEFITGNIRNDENESDFIKWVKNNPSGILLLDEFEKAVDIVKNVFLPVLDQGNMTTASGEKIYFSNMIICITSNSIVRSPGNFGFVTSKNNNLYEELAKSMAPELVNRIQNIVFFEPLSIDNCVNIVKKISKETFDVFKKKGIEVIFTDELYTHVAEKGYSPKFNAREIDRTWDKLVLSEMVEYYFNSDSKKWIVTVNKQKQVIVQG